MYVNKAIGIGFLHFNKNVTVNANSQLIIKNAYNANSTESGYCPNVSIYAPTSRTDILLNISHLGQIQVQNRSNSNLTNANVQGMLIWRAKGYP